jgi:hypothetical protein
MTKLSKEKKMQLVLVAMVTVGVIGGLWFFLVGAQNERSGAITRKIVSVQQDSDKMQKVITSAGALKNGLGDATNHLARIEGAMPSGDLFSWIVSSLKQFNVPSYKVDMPQIGAPSVGGVGMLPDFPYNEATVYVSGTAYYYDLGKFIADMENHFPYLPVQNLSLEPGYGTTPEEHERLTFHMQIVILVNKPANT